MNSFFSIYTLTPWDGLKTEQLTQVKLLSLKSIFATFPVIEQGFFDDLSAKLKSESHYSMIKTIKRIVGPNKEDYDITDFYFVWAYDKQNRIYQFLFQKIKEKDKGQAILVALAPPELGRLFSEYKIEAMHRILSLLNQPNGLKFLMILIPKGKSIAHQQEIFKISEQQLKNKNFIDILKNTPNISGAWFPSFAPRCPICNTFLEEIKDYRVSFGKLICPKCGYKLIK